MNGHAVECVMTIFCGLFNDLSILMTRMTRALNGI